jgi:hypothetical protein
VGVHIISLQPPPPSSSRENQAPRRLPARQVRVVEAGVPAWAWARDPGRRVPTPILPPARLLSPGWRQVSGCRGTARQRRKQDAAEIRLLTCSCEDPGLIKASFLLF